MNSLKYTVDGKLYNGNRLMGNKNTLNITVDSVDNDIGTINSLLVITFNTAFCGNKWHCNHLAFGLNIKANIIGCFLYINNINGYQLTVSTRV